MIEVYSDGGARGNPGPAAYGFVVYEDGKIIHEGNGYVGIATNNFAEYTALEKAYVWLIKNGKTKETAFNLDSQLVVNQLLGVFKIKNAQIREFVVKIKGFENSFARVSYTHIPRDKNKEADRLVNLALDQNGT